MTYTKDDIKKLGTIMCVFAHPDDETFTMGGILAAAAINGQKVVCITATKGELGLQDVQRWPLANMGDTRTKELQAALKILGVHNHLFLGYPDGDCKKADSDAAVDTLASLIHEHNPDSLFTFGPDGLTGHPDHSAVSDWVMRACQNMQPQPALYWATLTEEQYGRSQTVGNSLNFYYNTPKPPVCAESDAAICLHVDDELFARKEAALRAMPSQYQIMFERFDDKAIRGCFDVEAFVRAA